MRISDWSSDVCSSDLPALDALLGCFPFWSDQPHACNPLDGRHDIYRAADRPPSIAGRIHKRPPVQPSLAGARRSITTEIGRESCRERGCQYVSIWVVAVYLKKKN